MRSEDWPFEAWLTLALRGFGLPPDAFWAMSLRDWLSVTRTDGAQAMRRAESVARDLARLAVSELITSPLQGVLGAAGNSLGGQIAASWGAGGQTKPPVTVNMTVSGVTDASSFTRSQNQISSTLARAVSAGQRYT